MPAVASGQLRHKVALQAETITQDPTTGDMTKVWTTFANVWAQIAPLSGREFIAASASQSEVQGKIVIRYRDDVSSANRVVYRDQYYRILAALPDAESGREHLTLMTSEGVRLAQ
jgi:SPP1 family predicted phage head-tail adaptor